MKLFTHHQKVSQEQMDDLAIQIMEELHDETDEKTRREQMLRLLHSSEISVQTVCPNGKTLGFYLAREMSAPVLKTFQDLGGDLCAWDKHGNTLMFEALSGFSLFLGNDWDRDCIELLQQQGLNFAQINIWGQTPIFGLQHALNTKDVGYSFANEGHKDYFQDRITEYIELLQWAQQHGADLRHTDNDGQSIFDLADGAEFTPLRNRLERVRCELDRESLLQHISQPTTVTQRKM